MRDIEGEKLKEIEKQVVELFNQNALTAHDVMIVCETVITTWIIDTTLSRVQEVFELKKREP